MFCREEEEGGLTPADNDDAAKPKINRKFNFLTGTGINPMSGQIIYRGAADPFAVDIETRSVTGAVPGQFIRIPLQFAAEMRTACRNQKHLSLFGFIGSDLFPFIFNDAAFSFRQILKLL